MAVNNPDGSSVTVNQPPDSGGGTPPPSGPTWSVEYEVDFTAAGAGKDTNWAVPGASFGTVALPSIVGVNSATWGAFTGRAVWNPNSISTYCNPAGGGTTPGRFDLTHGTGLSITPTDNLNEWDGDTNSPKLWAALTDLIPGVTELDTIALQLHSNASQDPLVYPSGGAQLFGLSVNKNTGAPAGAPYGECFASAQAVNDGGAGGVYEKAVRGSSGQYFSTATNPTVFEILIRPGFGGAEIAMGSWTGSWPDVGTLADRGYVTFNTPCGPWLPAGAAQAVPLSTANAQIFSGWGSGPWTNWMTEMIAYKFRALKVV